MSATIIVETCHSPAMDCVPVVIIVNNVVGALRKAQGREKERIEAQIWMTNCATLPQVCCNVIGYFA
jgi:hypothetical protein